MLRVVFDFLVQAEIDFEGGVVPKNVLDESLLDGLPHGVEAERVIVVV